MKAFILVGLGSALGGMLRYGAGLLLARAAAQSLLPWGTLAVNWGGCLLAGLLLGLSERALPLSADLRALLVVGFCGGFTTFSALSAECLALLRQGSLAAFALYLGATLLGGLLLVWGGFSCTAPSLASH